MIALTCLNWCAVWEGNTLYVCESTDANPFGKVYWPPPYGLIRHEWSTWVQLAQLVRPSAMLPQPHLWC
jgi:hypothetical protein